VEPRFEQNDSKPEGKDQTKPGLNQRRRKIERALLVEVA
jgi:hypothetical protein